MADFCLQCAKHMWGDDMPNDLIGLSTESDTKAALYASALCEGCGPTQVDHTGRCIHHESERHDAIYWHIEEAKDGPKTL